MPELGVTRFARLVLSFPLTGSPLRPKLLRHSDTKSREEAMASADYWKRALQSRVSRRRAVIGAGLWSAGAALLAACGGGSSGGGGEKASGLTTEPIETTRQAVRGGTMQASMESEGLNFDVATGTAQVVAHG